MKAALAFLVLFAVAAVASRDAPDWTDDETYFWTGNFQLKQAYDTALAAARLDGTAAQAYSQYSLQLTNYWEPDDCLSSGSWDAYRWPQASEIVGTFRSILESGVWRIATVKDVKRLPWEDSTSYPSTGVYPTLQRAVIGKIAQHYKRTISVREVQLPASPRNDLVFRALWKNLADSTSGFFSAGGFSMGTRRNLLFAPSCVHSWGPVVVYTPKISGEGSGNIADYIGLATRASASQQSFRFGTIGEGSKQLVQGLFPQNSVVTFEEPVEAFAQLTSRIINAVIDVEAPVNVNTANFNSFTLPIVSGGVAFFRRDLDSTDRECVSTDVEGALGPESSDDDWISAKLAKRAKKH